MLSGGSIFGIMFCLIFIVLFIILGIASSNTSDTVDGWVRLSEC